MLKYAVFATASVASVQAHVAMTFPPATDVSDFVRDCDDYSAAFTQTELVIGETYTASWFLGRPHSGGLWIGMNRDGVTGTTSWGSTSDTTAFELEFTVPDTEAACDAGDCQLVLYNRASEYCSGTCPFISCSVISLVETATVDCPGDCHGHGTCSGGTCSCDDHWGGEYCTLYYECSDTVACTTADGGSEAVCVASHPSEGTEGQCFCPEGTHGDDCGTTSQLGQDTVDVTAYPASMELGSFYTAYWDIEEYVLEMVVKVETSSWVGFGVREVGADDTFIMGYNDMVIGAATDDGYQRVRDYWSNDDRRTPYQDGLNHDGSTNVGEQSLLDMNAWEDGDYTYMAWRRNVNTSDDSGFDVIIPQEETIVVYARGNTLPYNPSIPSPHSVDDWYTEDFALYHGANNKGYSTGVNLFDLGNDCIASQLADYDFECQFYISEDFTLHYTLNEDGETIDFGGEFSSAGGWHGCGFATNPGMYVSNVVVHDQSGIDKYRLVEQGFPSAPDDTVAYSDMSADVNATEDMTVVMWTSEYNTSDVIIDLAGMNYVLYAFGSSDAVTAHTESDRMVAVIEWVEPSCTPSTLSSYGYSCESALSSTFVVHWTLGTDTIELGGQFIDKEDGWAAFGISTDSSMPDSDVLASTDSNGLDMFHLSGYSFPSSPDSSQSGTSSMTVTDDMMLLQWTRAYDNGGAAPISKYGDNYVLFAFGGSADPAYHDTNKGIVSINFATGATASVPVNEDKVNHGALMTAAWGFCLPMGVLIARHADRSKGPLWFHLHRVLQSVGLILATVGFVIALDKLGPLDTGHGTIGIMVMVAAWLQPLNAFVRPHPKNEDGSVPKHRRAWEILHRGLGRVAVVMAFVNILLGCGLFKDQEGEVEEWEALYYYNLVFMITWAAGMALLELRSFLNAKNDSGPAVKSQEMSVDIAA